MSAVPIWGVVNQKGGVGKTTTAINLAAGLAERGERTLLVDADPQGNATTGLGIDKSTVEGTLFEVLQAAIDDPSATQTHQALSRVDENLWLLPATIDLAGVEPLLMNAVGKEMILRDALAGVRDDFDWVLIDGPPSLGLLTINILAACERLLLPIQCEFYALEGLSQMLKTISLVQKRINPGLEVGMVLLTMYDARSRSNQQVSEEVRAFFGEKVAKTHVPRNVRLSEAPSFGQPAVSLFPSSKGAVAYRAFVEEVLACGAR